MTRAVQSLGAALIVAVTLGCTDAPSADKTTATEAAPAAFNVAGLPTVEFSVPDMMCETSCVPAVRKSLAARPGVKDVQVDLETKTAVVAVDEAEFDADAAVADLLDLGFKDTHLAGTPPKLVPPAN
ncbi:MAG: heavy-metal-associated domain-containing protein [Planctomycetales bacterium]|nr:heavy-metal-associated domain-containing protein [Planctomycetales bacterium]